MGCCIIWKVLVSYSYAYAFYMQFTALIEALNHGQTLWLNVNKLLT